MLNLYVNSEHWTTLSVFPVHLLLPSLARLNLTSPLALPRTSTFQKKKTSTRRCPSRILHRATKLNFSNLVARNSFIVVIIPVPTSHYRLSHCRRIYILLPRISSTQWSPRVKYKGLIRGLTHGSGDCIGPSLWVSASSLPSIHLSDFPSPPASQYLSIMAVRSRKYSPHINNVRGKISCARKYLYMCAEKL